MNRHTTAPTPRVDFVDYAKGICIVMVVMMHSTLGVEKAAGQDGFMHYVVEFARPFRMPDFFLISGLFLSRVIDRDWRTYADRKVLHFAYFYFLWLFIQGAFRWPALGMSDGPLAVIQAMALAFVEPFGTLWFIYLLPIFFVSAKLLRRAPAFLVLGVAGGLETIRSDTGWTVIDEFANRWVYFLAGWYYAPYVFALADRIARRPLVALAGLALWALAEQACVSAGLSRLPGVSLGLGFCGACAVIAVAVLLAKLRGADLLRYAGQHSIVVYLAFFLPMAATRTLLLRTGLIEDVGWVSLLVTAVAAVTPLLFYALVKDGALRFLFERPRSLHVERAAPAGRGQSKAEAPIGVPAAR